MCPLAASTKRVFALVSCASRADGFVQQVTFRKVGAFETTQFQPVELGAVQGGQGVDRRDHLIIAKVFRIGRRQIRRWRLGHIIHGFILHVPVRELFRT